MIKPDLILKIIFSILLLVGFSACGKDYVTGKSSYNWYSIDKDISLGNQVLHSQMNALQGSKYKGQLVELDGDTEQLQRLQTIVNRLAKVSHIPDLPYEVHLADVPVVNAWAAPGGKVMVYSGLWNDKDGLVDPNSDDENRGCAFS